MPLGEEHLPEPVPRLVTEVVDSSGLLEVLLRLVVPLAVVHELPDQRQGDRIGRLQGQRAPVQLPGRLRVVAGLHDAPVAEEHGGEVRGQELGLPHAGEGVGRLARLEEDVRHGAPDPGLEGDGLAHGGTGT